MGLIFVKELKLKNLYNKYNSKITYRESEKAKMTLFPGNYYQFRHLKLHLSVYLFVLSLVYT